MDGEVVDEAADLRVEPGLLLLVLDGQLLEEEQRVHQPVLEVPARPAERLQPLLGVGPLGRVGGDLGRESCC